MKIIVNMSLFKNFRNYRNIGVDFNTLSKRFDQPTYLAFKLVFAPGRDDWYNGAQTNLNYDRMPHPLFAPKGNEDVNLRETYSAIDYLLDANEFTRAQMLEEFISKFNKLQTDYQWYFQKIDGIGDLLKVDPKKGMRVTSDKRLTITTLEGIDLRMSHIMNLYKKIAWDDTYQRWVLPDMMRYFTLKIYISEFRTFHTPNQYDGMGNVDSVYKADGNLFLKVLDNTIPTWVIHCEMCEFDIENIGFDYLNTLNVNENPEEIALKFGIKVGKMYEEQSYPIFKNMYLIDRTLNGFDRAKNSIINTDESQTTAGGLGVVTISPLKNFDSTSPDINKNRSKFGSSLQIAQNTFYQDAEHESGKPFNESAFDDLSQYDININPTSPNTWISNAINFGKSFVINFVKEKIDKAKMTDIPGLGFSFNEAIAALQSKNVITALGLIRKSVDEVARESIGPSELLGDQIVDSTFRSFLEGVSLSEATDDEQIKLVEAANLALNDSGIWEKIKDFSKATNLIGIDNGEINIYQKIEGENTYKNLILEQTKNDRSLATSDSNIIDPGPIYEGTPSSAATSSSKI